jgi:hypothetical protein
MNPKTQLQYFEANYENKFSNFITCRFLRLKINTNLIVRFPKIA